MKASYISEHVFRLMRDKTGIVIPVYLPKDIDTETGEALLKDTVYLFCQMVSDPAVICLSVDGQTCGAEVANRLSQEFSVSSCINPVNRGKLDAVGIGMRHLLHQPSLEYLVVVDQDGDHFGNELLNFVRAAQHIASHFDTKKMLVLGRRMSRHRPMGWLRGELEELCDRVLLDALMYNAAVKGRPLPLASIVSLDEFPDFHSGYKLFSRITAADVFLQEARQMRVSDTCYYRHACEAVMTVEAIEAGAYLGTVNRSTFNAQPISTFGLYNRIQMAADKMIWPCKRLSIPLPFAKQWLANHIPRLLLQTLAPVGKEELGEIRRVVITTLAGREDEPIPALFEPLFI